MPTPDLFICSDTRKRKRQTERIILWDRVAAVLVRDPGESPRVQLTTLPLARYQQLQTSFVLRDFFALPARVPSLETCGDDFRMTAAAAELAHTSDNDSTESAGYAQLFDGCVAALSSAELTWHRVPVAELRQLVTERVVKLPVKDARAAALVAWLTSLQ
jgi:hypothetical protein